MHGNGHAGFGRAARRNGPAATLTPRSEPTPQSSLRRQGRLGEDQRRAQGHLHRAHRGAAEQRFAEFTERWEQRYPAMIGMWERCWTEFVPFLDFPLPIRKLIYTTNGIESLNSRFRQAVRRRGHFPTEQDALKVLYLAVRNLDEYRSPSVGTRSSDCKQALQAFTIYFDGRIPTP